MLLGVSRLWFKMINQLGLDIFETDKQHRFWIRTVNRPVRRLKPINTPTNFRWDTKTLFNTDFSGSIIIVSIIV